MNHDTAQGKWQQLSGKIKQKWGKLTDDDLTRSAGNREYLVGKLHEQYGLAKDHANSELDTLGYGEHDEDVDLRSSSRSSAGRMDLASESGSDRKLQSGFANAASGSGLDDQGEASGYEQSRDSSLGNRDAAERSGTGTLKASGSDVDSQQNADSGQDRRSGGNSQESDYHADVSSDSSGKLSDKSRQQQKAGRNTPGSGNSDR
jgi:uncharacterized protein YjbJ (UPF0337 family)